MGFEVTEHSNVPQRDSSLVQTCIQTLLQYTSAGFIELCQPGMDQPSVGISSKGYIFIIPLKCNNMLTGTSFECVFASIPIQWGAADIDRLSSRIYPKRQGCKQGWK